MKCGGGFWWGRMGLRSVSGYLGLALVFVWDGALRERFCCCFSGLFGASIGGVLILVVVVVVVVVVVGGGGATGLSFYGVWTLPNIS